MTPKTTHPAAPLAPTPDGHLACRFCGIATPEDDREAVPVEADNEPDYEPGSAHGRRRAERGPVMVGVCDECRTQIDRGHDIADALPARSLGGLDRSASQIVIGVMRAAAVVGDVDLVEGATFWESADFYTRRALVQAGYPDTPVPLSFSASGVARWAHAARMPWSFVSERTRDYLRGAFDEVEAEAAALAQMPRLVRIAPPRGAGCGLCGLDGVDLPAVQVHRAGGPSRAAGIAWHKAWGWYACPACVDATRGTDKASAPAASAQDAAGVRAEVLAAVERTPPGRRGPSLPKVTPFVRSGATAAPERWAHIDLAEYAAEVRKALRPPEPEPVTLSTLDRRLARLEWMLDIDPEPER